MDISQFKHAIVETVRFHEVDLLGVCNNAVYFNYFEDARLRYIQDLKMTYELKEFLEKDDFMIMVHNHCDYKEPAYFDDELLVHTKIDFVKNSSFGYSHLVEKSGGGIIAEGGGVLVHINLETRKSEPLPQEFIDAVVDYEEKVKVLK